MKDLISVIVPIYNNEKYLEQCIESITNQTYKNIEIILINDGSTDKSSEICESYSKKDERIRILNKENTGVSSTRNLGLELAKGEYILFVDSDDFISKQCCEIMFNNIKEKTVDCVISGYNRINTSMIEKILPHKEEIISGAEFAYRVLISEPGFGFCHTKLWKKSVIQEIRFNQELVVGEDALFVLQAAKNIENVCIINDTLYNYRFNNLSTVRKYDNKCVTKYLKSMQITKKYIEKEYKNDLSILNSINNYISYHILLVAVNYCFNPDNNLNFIKQIKELKKICNIKEFEIAIKKSNYRGIPLTKKVALFTIKHRLYFFSMIIFKMRQIQLRRGK